MDQFGNFSVISSYGQLEYDPYIYTNGANRDLFTPPRDPLVAAMGSTMEHSEALEGSNNNYGFFPQPPFNECMPKDFLSIPTTPSAANIPIPTNSAEDGTPRTPIVTNAPTPGLSTGGAPNPGSPKKRKRKEPVHKNRVEKLRAKIEALKSEVEEKKSFDDRI